MNKHSKEDREKLFEENLLVQDYTFKVFDKMFKKKYDGVLNVDPEEAQNAAMADFKAMMEKKKALVEKELHGVREKRAQEEQEGMIKRMMKAEIDRNEQAKKEEERKLQELMGISSTIPTFDEEEVERKKKLQVQDSFSQLISTKLEAEEAERKTKEFEKEVERLERSIREIDRDLNDPQMRGN